MLSEAQARPAAPVDLAGLDIHDQSHGITMQAFQEGICIDFVRLGFLLEGLPHGPVDEPVVVKTATLCEMFQRAGVLADDLPLSAVSIDAEQIITCLERIQGKRERGGITRVLYADLEAHHSQRQCIG